MSAQKPGLHPRNRHQHRYDLAALCQTTPELTSFLIRTPAGEQSVDFANPQAVKRSIRRCWRIFMPLHTGTFRQGFMSAGAWSCGLYPSSGGSAWRNDREYSGAGNYSGRGVGANCIYPLIGVHEYGWRFTGSEVSDAAMSSAQAIIQANTGLSRAIRLRRQKIRRPFLQVSFIKMNFMTQRFVTRLFTTPPPQPARAASVSAAIWGRIKMMR